MCTPARRRAFTLLFTELALSDFFHSEQVGRAKFLCRSLDTDRGTALQYVSKTRSLSALHVKELATLSRPAAVWLDGDFLAAFLCPDVVVREAQRRLIARLGEPLTEQEVEQCFAPAVGEFSRRGISSPLSVLALELLTLRLLRQSDGVSLKMIIAQQWCVRGLLEQLSRSCPTFRTVVGEFVKAVIAWFFVDIDSAEAAAASGVVVPNREIRELYRHDLREIECGLDRLYLPKQPLNHGSSGSWAIPGVGIEISACGWLANGKTLPRTDVDLRRHGAGALLRRAFDAEIRAAGAQGGGSPDQLLKQLISRQHRQRLQSGRTFVHGASVLEGLQKNFPAATSWLRPQLIDACDRRCDRASTNYQTILRRNGHRAYRSTAIGICVGFQAVDDPVDALAMALLLMDAALDAHWYVAFEHGRLRLEEAKGALEGEVGYIEIEHELGQLIERNFAWGSPCLGRRFH